VLETDIDFILLDLHIYIAAVPTPDAAA